MEESTARPKKTDNNVEPLTTKKEVLEVIRNELEQRFNKLRDEAQMTTNVWDRHDIECALKELKFVYENILK